MRSCRRYASGLGRFQQRRILVLVLLLLVQIHGSLSGRKRNGAYHDFQVESAKSHSVREWKRGLLCFAFFVFHFSLFFFFFLIRNALGDTDILGLKCVRFVFLEQKSRGSFVATDG